jgi:hypothetical protein
MRLTKDQRTALMGHYLGHIDRAVRRHCHAIMLFDDGFSVRRVATLTSSEAEEVSHCIRRFRAGGVEALLGG